MTKKSQNSVRDHIARKTGLTASISNINRAQRLTYQGEERITNALPRRGADQISYTKVRNGSRLLYQSYRSGSRLLYQGWITSPVPRLGPVPKVDHSSCSKTRIGEWLGVNHVSPTKAGSRLLYQDLEWSASPVTRLGVKHVSCQKCIKKGEFKMFIFKLQTKANICILQRCCLSSSFSSA